MKLVCNVNNVYGNLKSDNSEDYAQKPQPNCVHSWIWLLFEFVKGSAESTRIINWQQNETSMGIILQNVPLNIQHLEAQEVIPGGLSFV